MKALVYIALCLPALLMILAGVLISTVKRDSTMTNHHFARNFNIKNYSKKVIVLFTVTGIVFSLGGLMIVKELLAAGLAVLFVMLLVFVFVFASIQKKN